MARGRAKIRSATRPSISFDDFDREIDAIDDDHADSMFTLNQVSAMRMSTQLASPFEAVSARFTGDLPGKHEIGVREATLVLFELQEVISEVGAVVRGASPQRGRLPADVVEQTELRLSPQVLPGSVIFTLQPPKDLALIDRAESLLAESLSRVFKLFDKVERPRTSGVEEPMDVSEALRDFGPRTARHLMKFAGALDQSGLNIDVGFVRPGQSARASRISRDGARFLKGLAEGATRRTLDVELTGNVKNIGTNNKHKFYDEQRKRIISITSSVEVTEVFLQSFGKHRVRVAAKETESVSVATGAQSYSYDASSAELVDAI